MPIKNLPRLYLDNRLNFEMVLEIKYLLKDSFVVCGALRQGFSVYFGFLGIHSVDQGSLSHECWD